MIGPLLIVLVMIFAIPLGTMLGGAVWSGLMGLLLADDADKRNEGKPS